MAYFCYLPIYPASVAVEANVAISTLKLIVLNTRVTLFSTYWTRLQGSLVCSQIPLAFELAPYQSFIGTNMHREVELQYNQGNLKLLINVLVHSSQYH